MTRFRQSLFAGTWRATAPLCLILAGCTTSSVGGPDHAETFGPMEPDGTGGGTSGSGDPGTSDSDSGPGTTTTGGGDDPGGPMRALVAAECQWLFGCCSTGELDVLVGPFTADADDCTDRVMDALAAGNTEPPIARGPEDRFLYALFAANTDHAVLDPGAVAACVDHLDARPCNQETELSCGGDTSGGDDPCAPEALFEGQLTAGETCNPALRYECADGLGCFDLGGTGVCVERAAAGETCFDHVECAAGLACDLQTGTCIQAATVGGTCSYADPDLPMPGTETEPCAPGLGCDPTANTCVGACETWSPCTADADCPADVACRAGVCQPPLTWAGPCEDANDCASGECDEATARCVGLLSTGTYCTKNTECISGFCDSTTSLCSATVSLGGPCPSGDHAQCGPNSACVAGSCAKPPGPGEACHPTTNPCDESAHCSSGFCLGLPLPNGSQCADDSQCASGLCTSTCKATAALGDECGTSGALQCGAGLYCDMDPVVAAGACKFQLTAGEPCDSDIQCVGACIVAWGRQVCDATPAVGQALCGGA